MLARHLLHLLVLALLAAYVLPAAPAAHAQQQGLSLDVGNSTLVIRVYPDGAVKPVYALDAVLHVPPGYLGKVDLDLSYSSSYERGHRSRSLDAALSLESGEPGSGRDWLRLELGAALSRHGTETRAWVSASLAGGNETFTAVVEVPNATVTARGAGPAKFRALVRFGGDIAGEAEGPVLNATPAVLNEWLARHGLGFVHVEKLEPRKAGKAVEAYLEGTIDVDAMLREAVANGLPADDAQKLKILLSEPLNVSVRLGLSLEMVSAGDRFGLHVKYSDDERGDLERADRLAREAAPLLSELFSALGGKVAESTGNQRAEGIATLLKTARGGAEEASLPLVEAPPTESRVEVHVHGNESLAIRVLYEGPRMRLSPGTGNPSEDAEKALTLLSAKLTELRSALLQVSAFLPGADKALPAEARVEPAAPGIKVSRTTVPLAELASVDVEAGKAATVTATARATPEPGQHPAATTTAPHRGSATRDTMATGGHVAGAQNPATSPAGHTGGRTGTPTTYYAAAAVVAVALAVAALLAARRRRGP